MNINGAGNGAGGGALANDGALSIEDRVMMMLMRAMKKQDKDIQGQAKRIEALQNKQGGAQGGAQGDKSIDVETMKLKRSQDKRGQMFDALRQIIDKYNETTKNINQSMSR